MQQYFSCFLQEEEEEQLKEDDSVKEETAEQEIPNWTWADTNTPLLYGFTSSLSISVQTIAHVTFY